MRLIVAVCVRLPRYRQQLNCRQPGPVSLRPATFTPRIMTASTTAWLDDQPPAVRAELDNLLSYGPDPAFLPQLAALLPIVPCAGLVDLYYDIWYCVPSRLAFRLAVRLLHDPERLADFLLLAERVLVDEPACAAFAAQVHEDDELHEVIGWLKRRAVR